MYIIRINIHANTNTPNRQNHYNTYLPIEVLLLSPFKGTSPKILSHCPAPGSFSLLYLHLFPMLLDPFLLDESMDFQQKERRTVIWCLSLVVFYFRIVATRFQKAMVLLGDLPQIVNHSPCRHNKHSSNDWACFGIHQRSFNPIRTGCGIVGGLYFLWGLISSYCWVGCGSAALHAGHHHDHHDHHNPDDHQDDQRTRGPKN